VQAKIVHRAEAGTPQGESPGTNMVFGVHSVINRIHVPNPLGHNPKGHPQGAAHAFH